MSKIKAAIFLALIFIAGAIAGGAVALSSPETFTGSKPSRPRHSPEDFANHLWNSLKERLQLDESQATRIEPIFRAGFTEVRSIQERSLSEVEEAIRRNHAEIAQLLTEDQREELQKMNQERQEFFKKRGHRPPQRNRPAPPTN